MDKSEKVDLIATALVKAQALIEGAVKDNKGNYGKYATLASVVDACKKHLTDQGISFVQTFNPCDAGKLSLTTTLLHTSGQFIAGTCVMPLPKPDPQGYGSAATYARRYSLSAMVGVCPEDDDGAAGSGRPTPPPQQRATGKPMPAPRQDAAPLATNEQVQELRQIVGQASIPPATVKKWLDAAKVSEFAQMTADTATKCIRYCRSKLPAPQAEGQAA